MYIKNEFFEAMCSGLHGMLFEDAEEDALEQGAPAEAAPQSDPAMMDQTGMEGQAPVEGQAPSEGDPGMVEQPPMEGDPGMMEQPAEMPVVSMSDSEQLRKLKDVDPCDYSKQDKELLKRYGLI